MRKIILLVFTVFTCTIFKTNAQVLKSDSLALVDLYNKCDGSNWGQNWNLNQPVKTWLGIGVTGNRVTSIQLIGVVKGRLPSSLGNLSALASLALPNRFEENR